MATRRKYFGTDGIRGRVGEYPIDPEFVLKLGWAIGSVFGTSAHSKVLVGKDTRVSGYMFEAALEAGLSAAGVDCHLLGPMPTPGIAYLTRTLRADAGIVISASHNPYHDNGIKFFSRTGAKLDDEVELAIEALLDKPMKAVDSAHLGKAQRIDDAPGRYIEFCKSSIASDVDLRGLNIVVDCANGATYHIAPHVFSELGADVIELGVEPDGFNINEKCGSTEPALLQAAVKEHKADLGIAFDGDGDRLIMVDHQGEIVDGDEILFIIANHLQSQGLLGGGVVGTLMTNFGLERSFKEAGIGFTRAKVGDRYVLEQLNAKDWLLGGETSGHLIYLRKQTTGDGIIAALQVLAALKQQGKSLNDAKQGMHKLPQTMINVPVKTDKSSVTQHKAVQAAVKGVENKLADSGRVLLRPSGTEPVIRVMVEGEDNNLVADMAAEIADVIREVK